VIDWTSDRLDDAARDHLATIAAHAINSFAPLVSSEKARRANALGMLACATFDSAFAAAVSDRVVAPLAERGIDVR
jgi:hypothetical protein